MENYGINTILRQDMFLAQIAFETDSFLFLEEKESGQKYEGNEILGNTEVGDGKKFKGRGFI